MEALSKAVTLLHRGVKLGHISNITSHLSPGVIALVAPNVCTASFSYVCDISTLSYSMSGHVNNPAKWSFTLGFQ